MGDFTTAGEVESVTAHEVINSTRVELVQMDDPYSRLKPGDKGTVRLVDDTGTMFVDWDCGSGLGVVYGVDRVRKL